MTVCDLQPGAVWNLRQALRNDFPTATVQTRVHLVVSCGKQTWRLDIPIHIQGPDWVIRRGDRAEIRPSPAIACRRAVNQLQDRFSDVANPLKTGGADASTSIRALFRHAQRASPPEIHQD